MRFGGAASANALLSLSITLLAACSTSSTEICRDKVEFASPQTVGFNNNEKLLVCGDEKHVSWNDIPPAQSEFHLRTFLSQRGYFDPKFEYKDNKLWVNPGERRLSREIIYVGAPAHFEDITLRKVLEEPLTSEILNTTEGWTLARLKNLGYACPEVKLQAVKETGIITVFIKPGPRYSISEPFMKDTIGLYEKTMRRFDAFALGAPYRYEWMKLSGNRAENDGIVVSSQLLNTCPQNPTQDELPPLKIQQEIIGGEKRLVSIAGGASTEEFPIFQASWKNVRLDQNGSSLLLTLYGSQRKQNLKSTYAYYPFKNAPRFALTPTASIEHANEPTYTSTEFEVSVPFAYKGDTESFAWLASLGPAVNRVYSNSTVSFFSLIAHLTMISHQYELYQTDPRGGYALDFNAQVLSQGFEIQPIATLLSLNGVHLFQLNWVEPPQWILGFRYGLSTTVTDEAPSPNSILPAQYFLTLGGDSDLRGFGRKEIVDGSSVGGLTSAFLGTELRFAKTLPVGFEPFVFFDVGALGPKSFELESTLYYSPGLGIRWSTPFGAIRSTLAHGYLSQNRDTHEAMEHYQFFLSFGKEF